MFCAGMSDKTYNNFISSPVIIVLTIGTEIAKIYFLMQLNKLIAG